MKITFKANNGSCPYFIYKDTKFYIQDKRDYKDDWVYCLYSKKLTTEKLNFETHENALNHVRSIKGIRYIYSNREDKKYLFTDMLHDFIIDNKIILMKKTATPLTEEFDKYLDCLNYAKQYVDDYIKKDEWQMSLLEDDEI